VVITQSAASDDAMKVKVKLKRLAPGMKHGCHSDLTTEMAMAKLNESFRCGFEKQIVDERRIEASEGVYLIGQSENDVEVFNGEQIGLASLDPAKRRGELAFGAMAIAARVIRDGQRAAVITLIDMTAESGSTAEE